MQTEVTGRQDAMTRFDATRERFETAIRSAPSDSLAYLKEGDDYSLGGLIHHVNVVLRHYGNCLDAMVADSFGPTRPADPPGLWDEANRAAKGTVTKTELERGLADMARLHDGVSAKVAAMTDGDFTRKAPVTFEEGKEPYPTGADDVLGWLSGHYEEHVPHVAELVGLWRAQGVATMDVIDRFNAAFAAHDVDGVMALMTDDCRFENTVPPPDGEVHSGAAAVRAFWEQFFRATPSARFETEDAFAAGDRATLRWVFHWDGESGPGHIRGVDVFRVRDGKVAEKLSYVKG